MKKFEPHYRLVRVGAAQKIEKASRQQRTCGPDTHCNLVLVRLRKQARNQIVILILGLPHRETTKEQSEGIPRNSKDEGCVEGQEEMSGSIVCAVGKGRAVG
jgi:hypothetical protein